MRAILKPNEEILLVVRHHWLILFKPTFFLFTVSLIFLIYNFKIGILYSLGAILVFIYLIFERKMNIWVVTNLRIIDEEGLFSYRVKESPLDKINNVELNQTMLGNFYDYGDVKIQTAAEKGSTLITKVQTPQLLIDTITNAQEKNKHNQLNRQYSDFSKIINKNNYQKNVIDELERLSKLKELGHITNEEFILTKTNLLKNINNDSYNLSNKDNSENIEINESNIDDYSNYKNQENNSNKLIKKKKTLSEKIKEEEEKLKSKKKRYE